jgi:hypothetical protein
MFRISILFCSLLILCTGRESFAETRNSDQPSEPDFPPAADQMESGEHRIRRFEKRLANEENPQQRKILEQILQQLSIIQTHRRTLMDEGALSKQDQEELKTANLAYRELREQFKEGRSDSSGDEPMEAVSIAADPATYETASGFTIRLRIVD